MGPCPGSPNVGLKVQVWTEPLNGTRLLVCVESEPSLPFLLREKQRAKCIIKWQKGGTRVKDNGGVYLMGYESWNERRKWIIPEPWWWCRASGLALLSAQGVHDAQGWGV